jgi:hypothetical protein
MKKIILLLMIAVSVAQGYAQNNLATIKAQLSLVNKAYDSARYFGFDVAMRYTTDTVFGKYENDAMQAKYILNQKNMYYKIEENTYMQNDSLSIYIMEDDKQVMVSKNTVMGNANFFQIKNFVDSLLDSVGVYYNMSLQTLNTDEKQVRLDIWNDTLPAPYTNLWVTYDADSYLIKEMVIKTRNHSDDLELIRTTNPYFKGTITMTFSNYHFENNAKELDETEYIIYNPKYNSYSLSFKYAGYKLNLMGIEEGYGEKKYVE